MVEVSKEEKRLTEYTRRKRAGERLIQLWVGAKKYEELKLAAESAEEPITAWVKRAVLAALRKWEAPEIGQSVFAPCSICGKKHDRADHFRRSR